MYVFFFNKFILNFIKLSILDIEEEEDKKDVIFVCILYYYEVCVLVINVSNICK